MNWTSKASIFATIFGISMITTVFLLNRRETKSWHGWQGVYYPNGCLTCEEEYIFSPIFGSKEECLTWGKRKMVYRENSQDTFECGKNCKWERGFNVCEETIGAGGTGWHE